MSSKRFAFIITRLFPVFILSLLLILSSTFISCIHDNTSSTDKEPIDTSLLQFTSEGHVLGFKDNAVYIAGLDHALRVEFLDGNITQPVAENSGTAQNDTTILGKVCYNNVWDNIDIFYRSVRNGIAESSYLIHPGGNPADISLQYNTPVDITADGALQFSFDTGFMAESAPFAWQEIAGEQLLVDVQFQHQSSNRIGFALGGYNPDYAVYIDPVYQWHTFFGSTDDDEGHSITIDSYNNIYVTGYSRATWNGPGPTTPLNNHTDGNNKDIVIVKLDSAGTYQWHTFYGSDNNDEGYGITVDSSANVYISGYSASGWDGPDSTAPKHAYTDSSDIVIIKLNSEGGYLWHTFYGSTTGDAAYCITLDQSTNIYVSGNSQSTWDGPGPTGPVNPHAAGTNNDFTILKLDSDGNYQWHTFHGSTTEDVAHGITVDLSFNAYVTGVSETGWSGPGPTEPLHAHSTGENLDIVILKLNNTGTYQWHTFYGTTSTDKSYGIALDSSANVYTTGYSAVTWNGPGAVEPLHDFTGGNDIFILKLDNEGTYQWHTFYGGTGSDSGKGIATDTHSNLFITGYSLTGWNGDGGCVPLNAHNTSGLYSDITIMKLDSNGTYRWHTFYGSTNDDNGESIVIDPLSNIYVTGYSMDSWNGPGDTEPLNPYNADTDIVIVKMDDSIPVITTNDATSIGISSAALNMSYTLAGFPSVNVRFAYKKSAGATWSYTDWITQSAAGDYSETVTGLDDLTQYDFRAELKYNITEIQGDTLQFITLEQAQQAPGLPTVTKPFLDDSGAVSTGTMADIGMGNINVLQPQVATNQQAVIYANVVNKGDLIGSFTVTLKINGQVEETRSVEVNGNSAVPVQFTVIKDEPGTYNVDLNGKQTRFTVVDNGNNTSSISGNGLAYIILAVMVSICVILSILVIQRRRQN